jgi:hypothetical protein
MFLTGITINPAASLKDTDLFTSTFFPEEAGSGIVFFFFDVCLSLPLCYWITHLLGLNPADM